MSKRPQKKLLYFIRGAKASESAVKRANSVDREYTVCFRNVNMYREGDTLEKCDAVLGYPPKAYLDRFGKYVPPETAKQEELVNEGATAQAAPVTPTSPQSKKGKE